MQEKISVKKEYILVKPETIYLWDFIDALGRLFKIPEYEDKNTIWVIPDAPIQAGYDDLYKLRDFIAEHYPKGNKPDNKTAIVVRPGIIGALADSWINIAKNLPYEIRVFTHFKVAEKWIIEG